MMLGCVMCFLVVEQNKIGIFCLFFFFFFADTFLSIITDSDSQLGPILSTEAHIAMSGDITDLSRLMHGSGMQWVDT